MVKGGTGSQRDRSGSDSGRALRGAGLHFGSVDEDRGTEKHLSHVSVYKKKTILGHSAKFKPEPAQLPDAPRDASTEAPT